MGSLFSTNIGYSKNPKINFNHDTCDEGIIKTKNYIKRLIKKLNNISNFSLTNDYKKYGIYPGQQIRRNFRKIFHHAGIYLYDGIIVEMGSGPYKCNKKISLLDPDLITVIGLNTLHSFKIHSKKSFKIINTPNDNDPKIIKKRLKKLLQFIGKWKYSTSNRTCVDVCNSITYNTSI